LQHRNPLSNYIPSNTKTWEWKRLDDEALARLIASPERTAWIVATYPPEETGRPGIICVQLRTSKQVRKMDPDRDSPGETEPWRTTVEFPGAEHALAETSALELITD
jgi:hypothetical protein